VGVTGLEPLSWRVRDSNRCADKSSPFAFGGHQANIRELGAAANVNDVAWLYVAMHQALAMELAQPAGYVDGQAQANRLWLGASRRLRSARSVRGV
jgi:hypothetical protein